MFLAWGPDVKPGVVLDRRPIVDAPCTMAALLGLEMPEADGKPIAEFLK